MKDIEKKHLSNNESNRLTREAIRTSLLLLMEKMDFESITISELVKKAGVSRQSFYRNYTSKEDIVVEIEEKILESFAESLNDPKYVDDPHKWLSDLFNLVKQNKKMASVLYKAKLFDILFPKAPFIVERKIGGKSGHKHYYVIGSLGALKSIGEEWFIGGMKESSDVMADICMNFFTKLLT